RAPAGPRGGGAPGRSRSGSRRPRRSRITATSASCAASGPASSAIDPHRRPTKGCSASRSSLIAIASPACAARIRATSATGGRGAGRAKGSRTSAAAAGAEPSASPQPLPRVGSDKEEGPMAASASDELPVARDRHTPVTIVGGGIAGLVAAISLAERRARVTLHEARGRLGGRAEPTPPPRRANPVPHALYPHARPDAWLRARSLVPPLVSPSLARVRVLHAGRLLRLPTPLLPMLRRSREPAPVDVSYRDWARRRMGAAAAEAAIGFASLPTFHADPGELSAAFVQERIAR